MSVSYYNGKLLAITSDNYRKIDEVQNKALRLITAAVCSMPITTLEIQMELELLGCWREEKLLKQFENAKDYLCNISKSVSPPGKI